MSIAIKAVIQHHAALARIDEMHREVAARRRFHAPAETNRHPSRSRSLAASARWLRLTPKGETA
jgi:hypothetical protein